MLSEELAHLPYQLEEEPLLVIREIMRISADFSGLLASLKSRCLSIIESRGGSVKSEHGEDVVDERTTTSSLVLCKMALHLGNLIIVKRFLQNRYRLSDEKCTDTQKKDKVTEKAVQIQERGAISWSPRAQIAAALGAVDPTSQPSMEIIYSTFSWVRFLASPKQKKKKKRKGIIFLSFFFLSICSLRGCASRIRL